MVEYSDPCDFGFRPETVMTALMPYEQFSSKTRRLILGIDMGIASVGVCLIDIRNHEIILMGSPSCSATFCMVRMAVHGLFSDRVANAGYLSAG